MKRSAECCTAGARNSHRTVARKAAIAKGGSAREPRADEDGVVQVLLVRILERSPDTRRQGSGPGPASPTFSLKSAAPQKRPGKDL